MDRMAHPWLRGYWVAVSVPRCKTSGVGFGQAVGEEGSVTTVSAKAPTDAYEVFVDRRFPFFREFPSPPLLFCLPPPALHGQDSKQCSLAGPQGDPLDPTL